MEFDKAEYDKMISEHERLVKESLGALAIPKHMLEGAPQSGMAIILEEHEKKAQAFRHRTICCFNNVCTCFKKSTDSTQDPLDPQDQDQTESQQ